MLKNKYIKMKKKLLTFLTAVFIGTSCSAAPINSNTNLSLSDKKATSETKALYKNLNTLVQKGFLFGHQDDLAYGVKWKYEDGKSDIKDVVGDYPAVYGWDIAGLENDSPNNIDGVPFEKMKFNGIEFKVINRKNAHEIILDITKKYHFPIVFDFPAGHIHDNNTLIFGKKVMNRKNSTNNPIWFTAKDSSEYLPFK